MSTDRQSLSFGRIIRQRLLVSHRRELEIVSEHEKNSPNDRCSDPER